MKPSQRRSRRMARLAVFLSAAFFLLAVIAHLAVERQAWQQQIQRLQAVHDQLRPISDRLERQSKQVAEDERLVLSFLAACRTVADIPVLSRDRVVAREHGYDTLVMSIPEGSHVLKISVRWKPELAQRVGLPAATDGNAAAGDDAARPGGVETEASADAAIAASQAATGEKTWLIPLQASSGYRFQWTSDRDDQQVRWELSGNHPDFEMRHETIPLDGFIQQGASWSGMSGIFRFPNQVQSLRIDDLELAAASPPGLQLMRTTLSGPRLQQPFEMIITLRLLSEGPACVTASDAKRLIILERDDLLMPYRGGGKYDLEAPAKMVTAASAP